MREVLPRKAWHVDEDWAWHIPVKEMAESTGEIWRTVIDTSRLTEADYARVNEAARISLGLVGTVRTRDEFRQEILASDRIQTDLTEAQLNVATDAALQRYQQLKERPGGGFEADAAVFFQAIDDVAEFLDIAADNSPSPGPPIYTPQRVRAPQ